MPVASTVQLPAAFSITEISDVGIVVFYNHFRIPYLPGSCFFSVNVVSITTAKTAILKPRCDNLFSAYSASLYIMRGTITDFRESAPEYYGG